MVKNGWMMGRTIRRVPRAVGLGLLSLSGLAGAMTAAWASGAATPQTEPVSFEKQVRPLLLARCAACHGEKLQRNGFRADLRTALLDGGDAGAAVHPGDSAHSPLIDRVVSKDPKKRMPPSGAALTESEVDLLRRWVDQGASGPEDRVPAIRKTVSHWSFQPIRLAQPPSVRLKSWPQNPIDSFVLAELEKRGIRPSPPADRVTLIRRLSLDLTGLPPTPEDVDAFLADRRPGAYERLVDRLLSSPHYGERWARRWLDLARYADSNGFTIDSARSVWRYRDWVIGALNRDLPFDQFTIEQLAGDMLPSATPDQVIATGFHRNTQINEEGGTDKEQFRVESVVDRVNTTGATWLGLTLGCAQCHTHKYDPITQKEYYQFFAFLNNQDEPTLSFPEPEQAKQRTALAGDLKAARARLAALERDPEAGRKAWEELARRQAGWSWSVLKPREFSSAEGTSLRAMDDGSLLAAEPVPDNDDYLVVGEAMGRVSALRLEALTDPSLPRSGPGFARGNFLLTEVEVSARIPGQTRSRRLELAAASADHSQTDFGVGMAVDGDSKTGWAINVEPGQGSLNTARTAIFNLKTPVDLPAGSSLEVRLIHRHVNRRYQLGRFRLSLGDVPAREAAVLLKPDAVAALKLPENRRTAAQKKLLVAEFSRTDPQRGMLAAEVARLDARDKEIEKSIPSTLVLKELPAPRETHLMIRGDFLRKGVRVYPDVPAALPALHGAPAAPSRLDLARWLVSPENPLTPRVTVNRIWQALFGTGLVETENDFGTQGTPPSHPALLDWLAATFRESGQSSNRHACGWSQKKLLRLIVTSATYRQSSQHRPELKQIDPNNRLLARQSRFRLEAEAIRDTGLAACGLLSRKVGGPSVYPPQPANLDLFSQTKKNWVPSQGEDRFRRGMYTFHWRSNPYVMFATFDAPNALAACTRRSRSNTPLGALMLANDQTFVEMAQALADKTLKEGGTDDEQRIRYAFRRALSRSPESHEAGRLLNYLKGQEAAFRNDAAGAAAVSPRDLPAGVDRATGAAWTSVARVLINLDEFITRE